MTNRPFDFLQNAMGKNVIVLLKGQQRVRGVFNSYDVHLNIVLKEAEILENGEPKEKHPTLLVRGDSIISISL